MKKTPHRILKQCKRNFKKENKILQTPTKLLISGKDYQLVLKPIDDEWL